MDATTQAILASAFGGALVTGTIAVFTHWSAGRREKQRWILDIRFKEYTEYLQAAEERLQALRAAGNGEPLNFKVGVRTSVFAFVSSPGMIHATNGAAKAELAYTNAITDTKRIGLDREEREEKLTPFDHRLRWSNLGVAAHMRAQLGFEPTGLRGKIERIRDNVLTKGQERWVSKREAELAKTMRAAQR